MSHARQLLSAAVASVVGKKEERAVASLFSPGGTHAIKGEFAGINDFEVVCYLVILPESKSKVVDLVKTDFAIITVKFQKPQDGPFSKEDQLLCIKESQQALLRWFRPLEQDEVKIEIRHVGHGAGTFWVEFIAVVCFFGGPSQFLHVLGLFIEKWGGAYQPPDLEMQKVGMWFKGLAWRLTPQPGLENRRPGCFGERRWLDRRTVRCRDCGFLNDCVSTIEEKIKI